MASRKFDPLSVIGSKRVAVRGRFFPNGTSDPVAASNKGKGWTVTRADVGEFNIVFTDVFNDIEDIHLSIQIVDQGALPSNWGSVASGAWNSSTKTLEIRTYGDTGSPSLVDFVANAGNSVSFLVVFKNTSA